MNSALETLEKIFYPVRKVPATSKYEHNSWLSHDIVVDIPGQKKPLRVNACSQDYGLVSNRELFTPIVEKLATQYDIEVRLKVREWSKFYVDFVMKDLSIKGANKKDLLFPRFRMNNSYDGSLRFSYHFGFWRLICSNGAKAPVLSSLREGKFMHTPQLMDEAAVKELMSKLGDFRDQAKQIAQNFTPLIHNTLSMSDAIARIAEIKLEVDYPSKLVEKANERLSYEATALKQPINDYLVYNAMNYALYQGDTAMPEHKRDKVDVQVLDFLIAENS